MTPSPLQAALDLDRAISSNLFDAIAAVSEAASTVEALDGIGAYGLLERLANARADDPVVSEFTEALYDRLGVGP